MDTDEIQTAFGLQPDDVHIVDKDVPTEDIAGTVSDYVGENVFYAQLFKEYSDISVPSS